MDLAHHVNTFTFDETRIVLAEDKAAVANLTQVTCPIVR